MSVDLEKLRSVGVIKKSSQGKMEQGWEKDMPAYRRLRKEGLQPKSIDGSAFLEQGAHDRFEIEYGRLAENGIERKAIREAIDRGRDLEFGT